VLRFAEGLAQNRCVLLSAAVCALARLTVPRCIQEVGLLTNGIGADGGRVRCHGHAILPPPHALALTGTRQALLQALDKNTSITRMDVDRGNQCGEDVLADIAAVLRSNQSMRVRTRPLRYFSLYPTERLLSHRIWGPGRRGRQGLVGGRRRPRRRCRLHGRWSPTGTASRCGRRERQSVCVSVCLTHGGGRVRCGCSLRSGRLHCVRRPPLLRSATRRAAPPRQTCTPPLRLSPSSRSNAC
jgi:hypothetical protein